MHVSVYLCDMYVCMCKWLTYMCVWGPGVKLTCLPQLLLAEIFLRQVLWLNLELTNPAILVGQWASEICLPPHYHFWGGSYVPSCLAFPMCTGILNSGTSSCLYTTLSFQPRHLSFWFTYLILEKNTNMIPIFKSPTYFITSILALFLIQLWPVWYVGFYTLLGIFSNN